MKLGICSSWGADLEDFRAEIRTASEHGFGVIGVGDTPAGWHDPFVSLMIAAEEAPDATVATMVTSPFLRHPIGSANIMSSLYDVTGGRVAYGLGTGGSTVIAMGRSRATQKEIREEFRALRALFAGEGTQWEGRPVSPLRFARPVPIYYSAFGPKAFALAGEQADGVILFTGQQQMGELAAKIAAVRAAAAAASRDPDAIDIWVISYVSVRPTREQALDDLKAFISVNAIGIGMAPGRLAQVPHQHMEAILEFNRSYDVSDHVVPGGRNVAMMDRLGLTEYLSQFDTTMGDVPNVAAMLRELEALGVSTFIGALPGHADPLPTIRGLAEARGMM